MIATEELKLNLGCRDRSIPGFLGVDIDSHPGVNYVTDIADLSYFKDGSVAEIYCSHALEHFPHTKTVDVLKEWHRVLKPNGILYVAVPDFKRTVELYLKMVDEGLGVIDWMENYLWGDQEYATAYHYAGFDFWRLEKVLKSAGFSECSQVENFPVGDEKDCSRNKSTLDGKSISLNVIAVKGDA